jgi:cystathionine beta-lyase/cystathionine gamma-synthase
LATHNNVKTHHIDTTDSETIIPYLSEKTRLVLLETPTNPLMKIADIPRISEIVHERCPNALVVVDNTMMSPYLQKPLELGADIVYHSGTKYLSGHHDLMAGVVAVKDDSIAEVTILALAVIFFLFIYTLQAILIPSFFPSLLSIRKSTLRSTQRELVLAHSTAGC